MGLDVTIVDLFSGVGWAFACQELGLTEFGIDNEPAVFKVRDALGWDGLCADVTELDPADWAGIEGLIASPPCQSWSRAGKGAGLDDPRGQLVWQPLVWALAIRPRWVACEQVPEARGAFEQIAHRLREVGYHADVYTLSAETFGVPQTRLRVFLVAHLDRPARRPTQTHQRYRKGRPRVEPCDMLGLLPWVSMAEALGCGFADRPSLTVNADSVAHGRSPIDGGTHSRKLFAEAIASGGWIWTNQNSQLSDGRVERYGRPLDAPAPTLTSKADLFRISAAGGDSWAFSRPSTTACADPRVSPPVHHHGSQSAGAVAGPEAGTDKPAALTEARGCRLMGFPDNFAGVLADTIATKADRWRIIGNAVCPPVARSVLETLL